MGDILPFPSGKIREQKAENHPPVVIECVLPRSDNLSRDRIIQIRIQVAEIMKSSDEAESFSLRENGLMVYDVIIDTLNEPIASIDLDAVEFLLALIFRDDYDEAFDIFAEYIHSFIRTFQEYHNPHAPSTESYDMKQADILYQQIDELIARSDDIVSRKWFLAVKKVLPTVNQVLYDQQIIAQIFEE